MKFDILKEAEKYLLRYIPPSDDSLTAKQKFARACALMDLLDNPQNKMSVIHVAGTSGKGSTAQIIAQILTGHGFKTGLTVSPHILDFRERTQINCMNVSENTYIHYLEEIVPSILEISNSQYGKPTFFEIAMAHAYFSFCREKVDYAIVETGMGGRFDASNTATASDKLCVLTKIGFDHQEFLGKTIFKIATEKAEIIHKSNLTLSTVQSKEAEKAIKEVAMQKKAKVQFINLPENIFLTKTKTEFHFSYKNLQINNLKTALHGSYQAENISLAVAAVYELGERDGFSVDEDVVRQVVESLEIPGRFQIQSLQGKTIVIDGAHNVQKMEAFISSLIKIFPNTHFDFLVSFKNGKDIASMLKIITPLADNMYITEFAVDDQGMKLKPISTQGITHTLKSLGYDDYIIDKNARSALDSALLFSSNILVITGSMYLVSELYDKIFYKV